MQILQYPHPMLSTKTKEVTNFDSKLNYYAQSMILSMISAGGIGLAANQIGVDMRMFVMVPLDSKGNPEEALVLINPEIVEKSGKASVREGCLSKPNVYATLKGRAKKVKVKYKNLEGKGIVDTFKGVNAVCVQHEIDHLDGIFFLEKEIKL